jgi:hypothetical protein
VFRRGDGILLPRLACGDKNNFVKIELVRNLIGGHEVTVVNGVKGSPHDTDASTPRGISHEAVD